MALTPESRGGSPQVSAAFAVSRLLSARRSSQPGSRAHHVGGYPCWPTGGRSGPQEASRSAAAADQGSPFWFAPAARASWPREAGPAYPTQPEACSCWPGCLRHSAPGASGPGPAPHPGAAGRRAAAPGLWPVAVRWRAWPPAAAFLRTSRGPPAVAPVLAAASPSPCGAALRAGLAPAVRGRRSLCWCSGPPRPGVGPRPGRALGLARRWPPPLLGGPGSLA